MTVFNQLNAASIPSAKIESAQQSHESDRIDRLRKDSTMLCVANTLVNIANIDNGTPTKHTMETSVTSEPNYDNIKAKPSLKSQEDKFVEDRIDSKGYNKNPMRFPYKLEISDMSSFPLKLMEALSNENHKEIISWLAHGRGFMIFQTKEFVDKVMPKYFKQTKFPSFTRKLSRWGFTRVQRGPEVGVYYHDLFLRDKPTLCLKMRSLRGKEGKLKRIISEKKKSRAMSRQLLDDFEDNMKGECADQTTTGHEDHPVSRNDFNERMNMNVIESNFIPVNKTTAYCSKSVSNSENVLRSMSSNTCLQNLSHSIERCIPNQNTIQSLAALHAMSHVPSLLNTVDFSGNTSNSLLKNLLHTADTQPTKFPQPMPCPSSENLTSMKMNMARNILIKSALQQIGRDLGVVM